VQHARKNGNDLMSRDNKPKDSLYQRIAHDLREFYISPYRQTFARAQRDEDVLGVDGLRQFATNF
jgi:hypothetical protein